MFTIHKISQRYNQREDRIELAIENDAGVVIRLWLTQRLASRMVAVLVKWLPDMPQQAAISEAQALEAQPAQQPSAEQSTATAHDVMVSFDGAAEEGLLTTIDMTQQQKDYVLTFKWGITGVAVIYMGVGQLLAYLSALMHLYHAAQWGTQVFPAALTKTLTGKAPDFADYPEAQDHTTHTLH